MTSPRPEPPSLPGMPRDDNGPVFAAPWQAQAFAMVLTLYDKGLFTWPEWAAALSSEISRAHHRDDGGRDAAHVRFRRSVDPAGEARPPARARRVRPEEKPRASRCAFGERGGGKGLRRDVVVRDARPFRHTAGRHRRVSDRKP